MNSPALWEAWAKSFTTVAAAEARAIWAANRLVKKASRGTQKKFYEIKDIFLERYKDCLIEGQVVREEKRLCWRCAGDGCERCCDGIYSRRTLYCHRLLVEGVTYSFHSYARPAKLSERPGEDKESYGDEFSAAEIKALSLPMSGLIRMLRWRAFMIWCSRVERPHRDPVEQLEVDVRPRAKVICFCAGWPSDARRPDGHHVYCRRVARLALVSQ